MRQWLINPEFLCRKHLMGEHIESHMFLGCIKKEISLKGYIEKGLVEIHNIKKRHDELADEMKRRNYNHKTPMENLDLPIIGFVNSEQNISELKKRCSDCRKRIERIIDGYNNNISSS